MLESIRLILRPWKEDDDEYLYRYASSPDVGPCAAWLPHTDVQNSREVIRDVLSVPETYAVVPKTIGHPVGSIGLMIGKNSNKNLPPHEAEIGYWIGVPFWGQGLIPEAVKLMLQRGFVELDLERIWCAYFDGNTKSKRVMEKCGFIYQYTRENVNCPLLNEVRTEHVTCLSKAEWLLK